MKTGSVITGDRAFGRIGVLAGGPSNEREISLLSGRAVYEALIREGLDAVLIDIKDDALLHVKKNGIDVAFIALHGRFGEDGTVQQMLELAGIPYTGSGVEASRLALDKIASKDIFIKAGIPTPRFIVLDAIGYDPDEVLKLGLPVVVKPQFEGSSIGLSVVKADSGINDALRIAFSYGDKVLVEEYIEGRELTVGILDDKPLPVIEIAAKNRIYDYKAKYNDPETMYIVPAPIGASQSSMAMALARDAHNSLGCRSFSRADIIMDRSGNMQVLEVNTIPGMTERSLLPKAAQAAGYDFARLCVKLIENAYGKREKTEKEEIVKKGR